MFSMIGKLSKVNCLLLDWRKSCLPLQDSKTRVTWICQNYSFICFFIGYHCIVIIMQQERLTTNSALFVGRPIIMLIHEAK